MEVVPSGATLNDVLVTGWSASTSALDFGGPDSGLAPPANSEARLAHTVATSTPPAASSTIEEIFFSGGSGGASTTNGDCDDDSD